ncbi:MAG TPA: HlyD family secretion protein [Stellaceae bacterium]|jgi:membrane fusion protein (multidrug efflux system)|nr:HlyD family secretion protein [Stellaceae bacterium]
MRTKLLLLLPAVSLLAALYGGLQWWHVWRFQQSTDDAYVESDISLISPKIEGYIKQVGVADNERVKAGQMLFVIDDSDFAAKVAQAQAAVDAEIASVATFETRHDHQVAMINQAAAAVDSSQAEAERADLDQKRYISLVASDVATKQRYETAQADAIKAQADLARVKAALEAEKQQLAVLDAQKHEEQAKREQARAALRLAQNDLDNTVIRAPVDGVVGNRAGQVGQYVKAGTQLMSLVPLPKVYVTANFKETQLTLMRPGQPAEISVDAYPDRVIDGKVESFAPASGAEFSLLPPDNATGNFTKIVQRVPVRIAVPSDGPLSQLLRPGLSVVVSVDTHAEGAATAEGGIVGTAEAKPAASQK